MATSSAATRALPIAPKHCHGQQDKISPFELEFATLGKAAEAKSMAAAASFQSPAGPPYGLQTRFRSAATVTIRRRISRRIELDVENDMNRYDEHQRAGTRGVLAAEI
jgi:hypothetical protein